MICHCQGAARKRVRQMHREDILNCSRQSSKIVCFTKEQVILNRHSLYYSFSLNIVEVRESKYYVATIVV